MTRYDFISGLKSALENEMNASSIQEHVNYYNEYINNEISNGRSEADVVAELGDPWIIAKTLLSSEELNSSNSEEYTYSSSESYSQTQTNSPNSNIHVFGLDRWWKKLLLILGVIGVIMIVFSIITGLISLAAPLILPFIIISCILRLLKKR